MKDPSARAELIQALSAEERRWQLDPYDWLKEHDMADDKMKVGGHDEATVRLIASLANINTPRKPAKRAASIKRASTPAANKAAPKPRPRG